jgi:hypothetical protein
LEDLRFCSSTLILSNAKFQNYSEINAVPRHVDLNSLVRNKTFLTMLNKGLPGYRGKEKALTRKEPAPTMASDG